MQLRPGADLSRAPGQASAELRPRSRVYGWPSLVQSQRGKGRARRYPSGLPEILTGREPAPPVVWEPAGRAIPSDSIRLSCAAKSAIRKQIPSSHAFSRLCVDLPALVMKEITQNDRDLKKVSQHNKRQRLHRNKPKTNAAARAGFKGLLVHRKRIPHFL